jgi:hypothetical protein
VWDVEDFSIPVLSCWSGSRGFRITPNEAVFASLLSQMSARFKEDEIIRISFVVEDRYDRRLILTYINSVASGARQYSLQDDFSQASAVDITVGAAGTATVDVYNIRVYGTALNSMQILNNYIADTSNVAKKLAVFDRNQGV